MNILSLIRSRFESVLATLADDTEPLLRMIRPAQDSRFGDYQANCAMPLQKLLHRPPREIAEEIVAGVELSDLCDPPVVAGPGFINLRLKDAWITDSINRIAGDDRLGCEPTGKPRHTVVDFSSPNVAKPMHVGHLRSTVIGDAISKTLRFAGHTVTTDNHIGDWGTQFGMIIYGYRHFVDADAYRQNAVAELARLYKLVNQLSDYHATRTALPDLLRRQEQIQQELEVAESDGDSQDKKQKKRLKGLRKQLAELSDAIGSARSQLSAVDDSAEFRQQAAAHPKIAQLARLETSKLHAGDAGNQALWDEFLPACLAALNQVYDRLGIEFDLALGESAYNPQLAGVVESLREQQLAGDSDGAICVFVEGNDAPFIVQKSDGAFTYATTDLATIAYRVEELHASEILYVVDKRQAEHFHLLFETAKRWRYPQLDCHHVSFGTVLGKDGKPYQTRIGDAVGLESLLDEAVERARRIVDASDDARDEPLLSEDERARVAAIVGLGGIKYADLRHSRDSDYMFDWDKMLATTGDTATYMQYAYARICGIFRKLNVDRESLNDLTGDIQLRTPEERALALQLLRFGEAVDNVLNDYRPHLMTCWLFETAGALSQFYATCSVQNAETTELRTSRLKLCDLVARGLRTGLALLGIETADVL